MKALPGTIGIVPPGALGVAFFYHLTQGLSAVDGRVFFVGLEGSASAAALRKEELRIADDAGVHVYRGEALIEGSLASAMVGGRLPEVLLVCPNPDQLLGVVTALVQLLERQAEEGALVAEALSFPTVVFSSNGIYFQRVRQIFVEKLEEATLFGRLPDLWPDLMPALVGRLLRGVTIQTGLREGSGREAVYRPGRRGQSRLAGGQEVVREACARLLTERGGWWDLASDSSPTRLEFDKGIINLISNFFGLIHAFGEDGAFTLLRVEQIVVPENAAEIEELIGQVFAVGKALRAYGPGESLEQVREESLALCLRNAQHVPSSLQWVDLRLRQGLLTEEFTPTEEWLIAPLIKYARSTGLKEAEGYFEELRGRLEGKLALGVRRMNSEMTND